MRKANKSLSNCDDEKITFIIKDDTIAYEASSLDSIREYVKDFNKAALENVKIFEVKRINGVKRELIFTQNVNN